MADEILAQAPDTIVLISPHATVYADYFHISPGTSAHGSFANFGAPQVEIEVQYDADFVSTLEILATECGFDAGTLAREKNCWIMQPIMFGNLPYIYCEVRYEI